MQRNPPLLYSIFQPWYYRDYLRPPRIPMTPQPPATIADCTALVGGHTILLMPGKWSILAMILWRKLEKLMG